MFEVFDYKSKQVEVIELGEQVLFNANDVAEILEISSSALRNHLSNMNDNQRIRITNEMIKNSGVLLTDSRKLNNFGETFLTEAGVYKLVFKSRKSEAEKFVDWIAEEVLPSIRKTGGYQIQQQNLVQGLDKTVAQLQDTITEYKKLCKITCSKKQQYINYIKGRLGISKANKEFEQVKARLFLILGVEKWEDIDFETANHLIHTIDESVRIIKSERPYEQMIWDF